MEKVMVKLWFLLLLLGLTGCSSESSGDSSGGGLFENHQQIDEQPSSPNQEENPDVSTPETANPLTILSISSPSNGLYSESQSLDFILKTSRNVSVLGTPSLILNIAGFEKQALYRSGSGSDELVFSYEVESNLEAKSGILVENVIHLNSGLITALDNEEELALDFSPINLNDVLVDSKTPALSIDESFHNSYINLSNDSTNFIIFGTCDEGQLTAEITINETIVSEAVDFICDGSEFSGSIDTTSLPAGSHTLRATLTDAAGHVGLSNEVSLIKDISAPSISLLSPSEGSVITTANNSSAYLVEGHCDEVGAAVMIEIDDVIVESTSELICDGSEFSGSIDATTLSDGPHAMTASMQDSAGNLAISKSINFIKDVLAPLVSITSPITSSYINSLNNSSTFNISGSCDESGQVVSIEVDNLPSESPSGFICDGSLFSGTIDVKSLAEGLHTLEAKLSDIYGNTGSSTQIDFIKDTIIPTVSSVNPPINGKYIEGGSLSFSVNFSENVVISGNPQLTLNVGGTNKNVFYNSGSNSQNIYFNYTIVSGDEDLDGLEYHSINIDENLGSIQDNAGNPANLNLEAGGALSSLSSILVDAIAPVVSITSSPDINSANQENYLVSGTCSENSRVVEVSLGSIMASAVCNAQTWAIAATNVTSLPDGNIMIEVNHDDSFGNSAITASESVQKDSLTSSVTINPALDITQANFTAYTLSGTCTNNAEIVSLNVGGLNFSPLCSAGFWSTGYIDLSSLSDGNIFITADHMSADQVSLNVNKDLTIATISVSSAPDINLSNHQSYTLSGSCSENGTSVDILIDTLNFSANCNSKTWTTGVVDVSSIADGPSISITIEHASASSLNLEVSKNTATPTVSSLSAPGTLKESATLGWNLNDPGGFTINDYEFQYRVKGNPTWLTFDDGINTNTASSVTGLIPNTFYQFKVRIRYDNDQYSSWSPYTEAQTKPDDPLFNSPNTAMNVGGSTDTKVVALYDNTTVTLNGSPVNGGVPLSKGEIVRLTTEQFDVIDADAPIYTAGRRGSGGGTAKANITWNPTSWAGKSFSFNAIRGNPQQLYAYATEETTITVKQGSTVLATTTIPAGSGTNLSWSVYGSYQVTSTGTILAFHSSGDPSANRIEDPKPLLPSAKELIGVPSRSIRITSDLDATNYFAQYGDDTINSGNLDKTDSIRLNGLGTGSQFQEHSLLISSDRKISVASFADSNGNCASPFLPTSLMRKNYVINNSADWVAFSSKEPGVIEVRNAADDVIQTLNLTKGGSHPNSPYKARLANAPAGRRFFSSVPVAAWYQPNNDTGSSDQDETILYGTND